MRYPEKVDRKHINIATFNKRFHLKEKYFHINTRLTKLLISYVSFLYPIAFIQYYANIWNRVRESFLLHDVHYYMYDIVWSYSFHKNRGFYIHIRLGNLGNLISCIDFFIGIGVPRLHYWDVSSILRYHVKRGKVPRIKVISFRKTSLTWRLRCRISTFKIVPINSYKNDYQWSIFSQKKYV